MKAVVILVSVFIFLFYSSFVTSIFAVDQDLIVNEVMYDFPDSDTNHEWVELFNSGDTPVTIVGGSVGGSWRINDGANHTFGTTAIQGSMTIGVQEYAIIAKSASTFLADNPEFTGNLIESSISLGNSAVTVGLRINADGALWGQLTYQDTQGAAGDGNSLQKKADGSLIAALPTPGKQNATDPPTPTPTPTSTPTPTPNPTNTPTPTPTASPTSTPAPTPTKTPTSTPTKIPTPTANPTVSSPQKNNLQSSVLGGSTKSGLDIPPPENNLIEGATKKPDAVFQGILIVLGLALIATCVILTFRVIKKGELTPDEEE